MINKQVKTNESCQSKHFRNDDGYKSVIVLLNKHLNANL